MGTRCVTILKNRQKRWTFDAEGHISDDGFESVEVMRMYRHWDGYPEGNGMDIARAVIAADGDGHITNRNWAALLLAKLFSDYEDYEVEPRDDQHGDLDYLYVVEGDYANYGGKSRVDRLPVTIAVWEFGWDEDYDDVLGGAPLFKGTAYEFAERFGDGL